MVMENRYRTSSYITHEQDDPQSSLENGAPDSPFSGDDSRATATAPPKKSRRSIQKRVVSVPIGEVDGSRSKGETYPPSDSWAWRKYGQKPIKGSPYPRYVRDNPTPCMVIISRGVNEPSRDMIQTVSRPPSDSAEDGAEELSPSPSSPLHINPFGDPPHLEFVGDTLMLGNVGVEYNWISDLSFYTPALVGPKCDDAEVTTFPMKEEDESLFGDLDELPECSLVFRRGQGSIDRCTSAPPICGST
uniref:WRKY domain-containing protein n=1 Tax=Chenopodium quinoa TaxID=63459 RepID=A0A803M6H3_CHEQI